MPSDTEARSTPASRRWIRPAAAAAGIVVVAVLAWVVLRGGDKPAPAAAAAQAVPAVGVRVASLKGVNAAFEFVGRIQATDKVDVRARIEGFLEKRLFREGADVKKGDLLYQIEKVQFHALVAQANANLAAAAAETINAKAQYERQLDLSKRQFSPQSTVDQNKAALDTASAKIEQAKAALTQAEVNLDYTDIRSPIDGRIGQTAYTVGNLVNPASGVLATIVSQDPIYVAFPVSVRDLETIREARQREGGSLAKIEIRLRLSTGKEYPLAGTWDFTDPQVNQQTDSLTMRAVMPNPDRALTDGQFVTAIIRERREEPRLVIPQAALLVDQAGYYALLVDGQHKVEQRRLAVGTNLGTDVIVTSGLKDGDKVIVDGVQKVRPGVVVKETVLPPPAGG
jgi:membrane fusion protein, multidrug efflux system